MPYIQNSDEDRAEMLAAIGVSSLDELFAPIPDALRVDAAESLPEGLTEEQLRRHCEDLGGANRPAAARGCFLGGGVYDHSWLAAVDHLMQRSEFLTAYTPYQPEASQGTLQWIFEFQSMIAELCGCEVANASMYDGASACAEAALLALGQTRRRRVVVSRGVHPHVRRTLATYLEHQDAEIVEAPLDGGLTEWQGLVDGDTAAVIVQQPNFLGGVEALDPVVSAANEHGALSVAVVDPVALGLLRSPGAAGVDLVVGDGQPLGVPMGFGGPSFGFFAARQKAVRRLPGRLVGITQDRDGRRAYALTFQTREQHIRREKATSNICTNNALIALRGCIHMAALGPQGLEEVACVSRQRALEMDAALQEAGAVRAFPDAPFFREVAYRAPDAAALDRFRAALRERGLVGPLSVEGWYPELAGVFTLACTERILPRHLEALAEAARSTLALEVAR